MPCTITRVVLSNRILIAYPLSLRVHGGNNFLGCIAHIFAPIESCVFEQGSALCRAGTREAHNDGHALGEFSLSHNHASCYLFAACNATEDIDQNALYLRVACHKGQRLI